MTEAGRVSNPAERGFQALAENIPTLCWMANADGRATGWVGTGPGIHDQKRARAKLSAFAETLEQRVAQRTAGRDRATERFGVAFSDVAMAGMSGIDLADAIRVRHPGLPAILAGGDSPLPARQGTDGFVFLHKPYSVEAPSRIRRRAARLRRRV